MPNTEGGGGRFGPWLVPGGVATGVGGKGGVGNTDAVADA